RTGRILNILYLMMQGMLDIPILYISSYIIKNKSDHYKLLNHNNKTYEWEDWIIFMLTAVEETALNTIQKINKITQLLDHGIALVKTKAEKIYRRELVDLVFEQPYCKIDYVVEQLGVERKAASRYLKELENIGLLKSEKIGRETLYINVELIKILGE
ncbi:MAG: Fic family protein, partial [Bacteroidetes bacterium]|nr:Fic family protein [Bacteroidota bacterium]